MDLFGTEMPGGVLPARGTKLEVGKGRVIKPYGDGKNKVKAVIVSIGTRLAESVVAARDLEQRNQNLNVAVVDARWMKPMDKELMTALALESDVMVTVEEGSSGGFGDAVLRHLSDEGVLDQGTCRVRSMVIPDMWIEQGPQKDQYDLAGLNAPHIADKVEVIVEQMKNYRPKGVLEPNINAAEEILAAAMKGGGLM